MTTKSFSYCWRLGLLLLAGFCITFLAPNAHARNSVGGQTSGDHGAKIMGHLPLDLNNFQDAVLREKGDHRFLYIQNSGSSQITIVDVSRRKKPKIAGTTTLGPGTSLTNADFEGDVAIVPSGGKAAVLAKTPPSEISIWDYSKPGSPQLIKKFTGVKKVITGSGNIVYILDANGLTIVQVYDQQMRDWDYDTSHIGG